jgi:hypothetical protein
LAGLLNLCYMKKIFLSLLFITAAIYMNAQSDNWKVYHNKQLLLSASEESETKNTRSINKADLDKIGELIVMYEAGIPDKEWKRNIAIFDEKDSILFEKAEINKIQVSNADLKKMLHGKTKIKIYTWAIPKDPAKAAVIRIRRVHLCTLQLK